jgi:hypothetical protein
MIGDPTGDITRNFDVMRRGPGPGRPRHLPDRPRGRHPVPRGHRRGHRPQRRRAAPQGQGRPVRGRPPGRGLPGQVGRGRRHPGPVAGPRRQDLSSSPLAPMRSVRRADFRARRTHICRPATLLTPPPASSRSTAMLDAALAANSRPTSRRSPSRSSSSPPSTTAKSSRAAELLDEIASLSDKITVRRRRRRPRPSSRSAGRHRRAVRFAGIPLGHEFTSLVLALLQVGGHPPPRSPEDRAGAHLGASTTSRPTSRSPARTAPTWCRRSTS